MKKIWKGRINLAYSNFKRNYWVNFIDNNYEERFNYSFPFYWLANLFAKFEAKRNDVPIYDNALKSKSFWNNYNNDETFKKNHLIRKGYI